MSEIVYRGWADGSTVQIVEGESARPLPLRCGRAADEVNHSPTGFAWGYLGSGPAQLAFSLLCEIMPASEAKPFYQPFKNAFVSRLPQNQPWSISRSALRAVVEATREHRRALNEAIRDGEREAREAARYAAAEERAGHAEPEWSA